MLQVRLAQKGPIPLRVAFDCEPGELMALVGPSGGGKSTVLRSIAGLYRPSEGRIECHGSLWYDSARQINVPPQHRRVGMVFQSYALFPHLSAVDNVSMALGHLPPSQRVHRARELLTRVHLSGIGNRRPSRLSGGEQQRVALARALAREPRTLLLDEPFSAVDQVTRRKLRMELAELTRSLSIPIILVTHDLDEACMLADRMCILHAGRTLQHGPPTEVMRRPDTAAIARLIDMRNIYDGRIAGQESADGVTYLAWEDCVFEVPHRSGFGVGERVTWCIPPDRVLLHRRDRPSRGVRENPVSGTVLEVLTVGGISTVVVALDQRRGARIHMDLVPHVLERNHVRSGDRIGMSLLAEAIHIMPWQPLKQRERQLAASPGDL